MKSADDILFDSLQRCFDENEDRAAILQKLLNKDAEALSLRTVDWLVTNYSKKFNVTYVLKHEEERMFNVYLEYKAQLKSFSKRRFDVFKRHRKFEFCLPNGTRVETNVAQLNFFRWAITHGVVDYCMQNLEAIEKDMNESTKHRAKTSRKRQQLSRAAVHTCTKTPLRVRVTFH
jgi:hypothetical protein